jgi:hypothetical protein
MRTTQIDRIEWRGLLGSGGYYRSRRWTLAGCVTVYVPLARIVWC